MNALVSICVPVYNVAPYIERCVQSLMQQTYDNLEYIFVDDCSTDQSVSLLQAVIAAYPQRQPHVRILHNDRNHGLAYTRRVSIEAAKGEFVLCVDSDDYIDPNTVERLCQGVQTADCDIVFGGYVKQCGQQQELVTFSHLKQCDSLLTALLEDNICNIWGNLIRRSLFDLPLVHFAPEGQDYMEDRTVMLYLSHVARQYNVVDEPLYHYIQHDGSVSAGKTDKHFRCLIRYWELADAYLAEIGLTDRYRVLTDRQKLTDKAHLLLFCNDVAICRKYAGLFPEAEANHPKLQLSRGKRLTRFLVRHQLWGLMRLYKHYIRQQ